MKFHRKHFFVRGKEKYELKKTVLRQICRQFEKSFLIDSSRSDQKNREKLSERKDVKTCNKFSGHNNEKFRPTRYKKICRLFFFK